MKAGEMAQTLECLLLSQEPGELCFFNLYWCDHHLCLNCSGSNTLLWAPWALTYTWYTLTKRHIYTQMKITIDPTFSSIDEWLKAQ